MFEQYIFYQDLVNPFVVIHLMNTFCLINSRVDWPEYLWPTDGHLTILSGD
jgi:hypothetical protein